VLVVERNFAKLSGEIARDYFRKRHEPGLRVGWHGEVALERSGAVGSADPRAEDEGVAAVEGDSWFDED
jgi:predicted nucleic acid-binding protein